MSPTISALEREYPGAVLDVGCKGCNLQFVAEALLKSKRACLASGRILVRRCLIPGASEGMKVKHLTLELESK